MTNLLLPLLYKIYKTSIV